MQDPNGGGLDTWQPYSKEMSSVDCGRRRPLSRPRSLLWSRPSCPPPPPHSPPTTPPPRPPLATASPVERFLNMCMKFRHHHNSLDDDT
jgi:hypothetical protein